MAQPLTRGDPPDVRVAHYSGNERENFQIVRAAFFPDARRQLQSKIVARKQMRFFPFFEKYNHYMV